MKAAVLFEANTPLSIEDVTVSKPTAHEVLIRTMAVGVCRSDLHFVDGAYPHAMPTIPGHEACGVVEAVLFPDGDRADHAGGCVARHEKVITLRVVSPRRSSSNASLIRSSGIRSAIIVSRSSSPRM